jgi:ketosteroid isomerase-like protein
MFGSFSHYAAGFGTGRSPTGQSVVDAWNKAAQQKDAAAQAAQFAEDAVRVTPEGLTVCGLLALKPGFGSRAGSAKCAIMGPLRGLKRIEAGTNDRRQQEETE